MKYYITHDGKREMWIKYDIPGAIPEKNYILYRDENREVHQDASQIKWESETRAQFADQPGWIENNFLIRDYTDAEYTPLAAEITIFTPEKSIIIRQAKSILDALEGVAYVNDCSVAQLVIERVKSDLEHAEIVLHPAHRLLLPAEGMHKIESRDRQFRSVTDTAYDPAGFSLNKENQQKDAEFRSHFKTLYDDQVGLVFPDDVHLAASICVQDLPVKLQANEKFERAFGDIFPNIGPDADNIAYSLSRCLVEAGAIADDRQISRVTIHKDWRLVKNDIFDDIYIGGYNGYDNENIQ